jgi:outer membrane murein-binding lipoprotein Lpp
VEDAELTAPTAGAVSAEAFEQLQARVARLESELQELRDATVAADADASGEEAVEWPA